MKAAITTANGLEFSAEAEVKEILGVKSVVEESIVKFEVKDYYSLVKLSYLSQSAHKLIVLLEEIQFKSIDDFSSVKLDLTDWVGSETTFAVRCKKDTEESFDSADVEGEVGKNIDLKVNLDNPDLIVYVHVHGNKAYFGVDITGMDLSKRQYKIFNSVTSLKGTTAYSLLKFSGVSKDGKVVDVNCRDGTLAIEAALYSCNFPVRYYEKDKFLFLRMKPFSDIDCEKIFSELDEKISSNENVFALDELQRNVTAAQKNSKVAGVNKNVKFTRVELDWVDTKFKEKEVDCIVTNFIWPTRHVSEKEIAKKTKELMYQAKYVLTAKGNLTLITRLPDMIKEFALKEELKVSDEKFIEIGDEKLTLMKIIR